MENQNPIDIILKLVVKGEIDPWNIDITVLADKFLNEIKSMYIPDLLTASKVLVAAALLLRMKAESLDQQEEKKEGVQRKRIFGIKRFYTIEEIAQILKDYTSPPIETKPKKERKPYERKNTTKKPLSFDYKLAHNILEDAIKYFEEELKYVSEVIRFSQINYPNKPQAFIALLFLNNDNKINLYQEEPFDEIYIEPVEVYNYSL
ncbi:MAG: segregation/condensation protein A [Sulfurihydrogenibium sp.]|uniref:Segregation and condensation protein A n=1 Tax=Sulfurihydrogenibium azorense TaxID=309806 RepID=A0A832DE61_9AQUI|nr:MAG: chromosome segregation protein ScpA [Sulfurihydrogenibium sp.]PMP77058.1 MAG: chromosome segregation protein ScpA [Sulfurihydrogenibium sp.]HEV09182.1 segregation/condensation protein A [Sulfurihydrogenibium azorense]